MSTDRNASAQPTSFQILRLWRDLEVFNIPDAPSARDNDAQTRVLEFPHSRAAGHLALPWEQDDFQPTKSTGYLHIVYIGVAETEELSRCVLTALCPASTLKDGERERLKGNGWLAAFVVDELGHADAESYLPASFAHGVAALIENGTLEHINKRLQCAKDAFALRCHRFAHTDEAQDDDEDSPDGSEQLPVADASPQAGQTVTWEVLNTELDVARQWLQTDEYPGGPALGWRLMIRSSRVKRKYLAEALKAATDFLNSFYLDDLDRLIAQAEQHKPFGKALQAYLGTQPITHRFDILTDHAAMSRLVSSSNLPPARWPASPKHPLVLAQQAAVAQITQSLASDEGIIGINGPPGTGKTTLLCDVIANILTNRALAIAQLKNPVEIFEKQKQSIAGKFFYPIRPELIDGTSIVVTSNNNNAVKNITQELPARKKLAEEFQSADYFAEVMREIFREQKVFSDARTPIESWGVIAAALGNASNRRSFAKGFFRDEFISKQSSAVTSEDDSSRADSTRSEGTSGVSRADKDNEAPPSIKQVLEAATQNYARYQGEWKACRDAFLEAINEFNRLRELLCEAERAAYTLDKRQTAIDASEREQEQLQQAIAMSQQRLDELQAQQAAHRTLIDASTTVLKQLRAASAPTLWEKLQNLLGRESARMKQLRIDTQQPTQTLAAATSTLSALTREEQIVKAQLVQQLQHQRQQKILAQNAEEETKNLLDALQSARDLGVQHLPDSAFWSLPATQRHRCSVGVSEDLDRLRARIFLQAVDLHRLTILANAGKFLSDLRLAHGMLSGQLRDKLKASDRPMLWNAFFFVVPVVSTTLASFDRLFVSMGQDSLGWLLIDEAGQATPQSAAGAIWRSRRVVAVGDPLQIEPVFTVPGPVVARLRQLHGVQQNWTPPDESVQTLVDRVTPLGAWLSTDSDTNAAHHQEAGTENLWTGMPLRTHRRCDDPMFSIANHIAYGGQMVQGRVDQSGHPKPWSLSSTLGESAWIDVRSQVIAHPVSNDEIDCLDQLLQQLHPSQDIGTIYVITPFRKIAQACRARLPKKRFPHVEVGTVHTFQGKEANIVFLILGTAPGDKGEGARQWAASKPNLLNVAVTRAKSRLYVIGDSSQWGKQNYFRTLLAALPIRSLTDFDALPSGHEANLPGLSGTFETGL